MIYYELCSAIDIRRWLLASDSLPECGLTSISIMCKHNCAHKSKKNRKLIYMYVSDLIYNLICLRNLALDCVCVCTKCGVKMSFMHAKYAFYGFCMVFHTQNFDIYIKCYIIFGLQYVTACIFKSMRKAVIFLMTGHIPFACVSIYMIHITSGLAKLCATGLLPNYFVLYTHTHTSYKIVVSPVAER